MEAVQGAPAPALAGLVHYRGYRAAPDPAPLHRGLPSPYLTLIVTLGEPILLDRAGTPTSFDTVVGGLHRTPEIIHQTRAQGGVFAVVHPLAARALFGCPAGALSPESVPADDVLGPLGRELHERVAGATDWAGRFAAMDAVLGRRLGSPDVAPELVRAWRRLTAHDGALGVGALSSDVGWSERHLGQRFRAEFGLGPKAAARVMRFHRARHRIARRALAGAPLHLAEIAADGGFADQAHLAREFRDLAGVSPTRWIAEEIGNVQVAADIPVPPSAA